MSDSDDSDDVIDNPETNYIQKIIRDNPDKYNKKTYFIWIGTRSSKHEISHVKAIEIKRRYRDDWFLDISRPYGLDFIAVSALEKYRYYDEDEKDAVLLFTTEKLVNKFYRARELVEKFRVLISDNILKQDIKLNYTTSRRIRGEYYPYKVFSSPLDNFKILGDELDFVKKREEYPYNDFIETIVRELRELEYNVYYFAKSRMDKYYIVIYSRYVTDTYASARESSKILNRIYNLNKNNTSLYQLSSKTNEVFYFDPSILIANSEFFETKLNSIMKGETEETRFRSQTLDYFQMYCYNYKHEVSKEIEDLHNTKYADKTSDEYDEYKNPEEIVKVPYNGINWLPKDFKLAYILDLFKLMTYYSIKDENFGLELLAIVQVNIRDFEDPLGLIKDIKKFQVPGEWKAYKQLVKKLSNSIDVWVKEGIIG